MAQEARLSPLFTWRSAVIDSGVSANARHVALTLSLHMSERQDSCYPSLKLLCEETGRGRSTVVNAIRELEEAGLLEVTRESGGGRAKVNRYRSIVTEENIARFLASRPKLQRVLDKTLSEQEESIKGPEARLEDVGPRERSKDLSLARPRDPIWDCLTDIFGDATTETRRSLRGKVCRSLRTAGATPDEIVKRSRAWPRHFEGATFTELALEKHWDTLGRPPLRQRRS